MPARLSATGTRMLLALHAAAEARGWHARITTSYRGRADWLVLYGVGGVEQAKARAAHVGSGRHAFLWDLGYFTRAKLDGYLRLSVDRDHPQHLLDRTPADASRLAPHGVGLREDADPAGPIILVGLGRKSRAYLQAHDWEKRTYESLLKRFPRHRIIHRPKPGQDYPNLFCERDLNSPVDVLLRGASLVVARHSNVCVDAVVAGVPFECEDGAAKWLTGKPFTADNRFDFLRRLAWWQWHHGEADEALSFMETMV